MAQKKGAPIGFGRIAMPDEAGKDAPDAPGQHPAEREPDPPLVEPLAIDDVEAFLILGRYGLQPLVPLAKFEYQLLELIAAFEKKVRELDPDL